jgi:hypothetical protein
MLPVSAAAPLCTVTVQLLTLADSFTVHNRAVCLYRRYWLAAKTQQVPGGGPNVNSSVKVISCSYTILCTILLLSCNVFTIFVNTSYFLAVKRQGLKV